MEKIIKLALKGAFNLTEDQFNALDEKLAHLCFIAECTKDKDQRNDFATILNITGVLSQFEQNK